MCSTVKLSAQKLYKLQIKTSDDVYFFEAPNSTVEDPSYSGGCFQVYRWCSQTTRVPIYIYLVGSVIVLGFGFPFHFTPTGVIFSEVLGPRKQV